MTPQGETNLGYQINTPLHDVWITEQVRTQILVSNHV